MRPLEQILQHSPWLGGDRPCATDLALFLTAAHTGAFFVTFRDLQHPRELLAFERVQLPSKRRLRRLGAAVVGLPRLVLPLPFGQCPVVGESRRVRITTSTFLASLVIDTPRACAASPMPTNLSIL